MLIPIDDCRTLRLKCTHCQAFAVFSSDSDALGEVRCSSCNTLMADAHHLVNTYRSFFADLARFGKGREAVFEVAWRDPYRH